jgi:uncharacterized damage-inducible protein DinB
LTPQDFRRLFAYSYWANEQLLEAARGLDAEAFTAASEISYRGIRGTLVHTLDVERSWRRRIRGEPRETWDVDLPEVGFASVRDLETSWRADQVEMLAWLDGLDQESIDAVVDLGPRDRFPLSTFLLHILTHSAQQRRDVALLLERAGHPPPEIEFLNYADASAAPAQAVDGA